jgi:hypothetical protein
VTGEEWARLWEGVESGMKHPPGGLVISFPRFEGIRRWLLPAVGAAAVLAVCAFLGARWIGQAPDSGGVSETRKESQVYMDAFAELRAGLRPEISVDTAGDEDMTILDYKSF